MSRKSIWGAIAAVLLTGALVFFYGGSQVPAGQPPLERLKPQNVDAVKSAFNVSKDDVRVLLFLSPT
jgi:hypothetical protein